MACAPACWQGGRGVRPRGAVATGPAAARRLRRQRRRRHARGRMISEVPLALLSVLLARADKFEVDARVAVQRLADRARKGRINVLKIECFTTTKQSKDLNSKDFGQGYHDIHMIFAGIETRKRRERTPKCPIPDGLRKRGSHFYIFITESSSLFWDKHSERSCNLNRSDVIAIFARYPAFRGESVEQGASVEGRGEAWWRRRGGGGVGAGGRGGGGDGGGGESAAVKRAISGFGPAWAGWQLVVLQCLALVASPVTAPVAAAVTVAAIAWSWSVGRTWHRPADADADTDTDTAAAAADVVVEVAFAARSADGVARQRQRQRERERERSGGEEQRGGGEGRRQSNSRSGS
ncbi:Protein of unknown function [Gryllus bimaculatus]|nr:Protein of unknown function [Gryllus bimaculatus]